MKHLKNESGFLVFDFIAFKMFVNNFKTFIVYL